LKKHIQHISGFFRLFLLGSFLLMAPAILAQSSNDTIPTVEEGVIVEEPPPPEVMMDEEEEDEKDDEEKKSTEHFTPLEEKDSLVLYKRRLATGYADKLKKDDDFWYADASIKKEKEKEEARIKPDLEYVPFMQRTWVQTLLWIIIIGGFAYAIMWYLMDSQVGLFRKKNVPVRDMHGAVEEMPEDIFAIQFQQEIDKALAQGNYRLAVRVHFLRLLRNLSDKNLIQYKQEKTNLDYLMELSSKTWYAEFFRLTRHFEYSWYGHFEVEEPTYRIIASEFNQFEKKL
jgi:hypothetical protein